MKKLKIINLWGAPCSGKSATAAGLYHLMKVNGYKVELVKEYAKEMVWKQRHKNEFTNQVYIAAKQHNEILFLKDHDIEWAITDSPLLLTLMYSPKNYFKNFEPLIFEMNEQYTNYHCLLQRNFDYVETGRNQKVDEADLIHQDIESFLTINNITHDKHLTDYETYRSIFTAIVGIDNVKGS